MTQSARPARNIKQPQDDVYATYLLHFEPSLGRVRHYIGSTPKRLLANRLRAHAHGYGAALTRRAVRTGASLYLAAVYLDRDRSPERQLKRAGHAAERCPICRPGIPLTIAPRCLETPMTARHANPTGALDWSPARSPNEKRPRQRLRGRY